ncbi:MAG: PQQ-binding-like beta-propeller repeat protein [Planctomycetaceae bacterium]
MSVSTFHRFLRPVVAVLLTSICCGVQAEDWPNWMGPELNGISSEQGWSTQWPKTGLPEVWTRPIGIGFSSISLVGNSLYTMGHNDGKETVWCLDAGNGQELWTHSYPAELNNNLYEGGPGATPTVDGDLVYTLSIDGQLLCLNRLRGNVVWQRSLQEDLGVGLHEWGFDSSPLILNDQLLVQGGRVVSYNKHSGNRNWVSAKHEAGYGSVRAFSHNGQTLLASLDNDGLRILSAEDGTQVAFTPWPSPFRTNSSTPIIVDDTIFISTGYNVGCGLFRLKDRRLERLYASQAMRNHFNNSILFEGYLYGMDGNSNLGRVVTLTCMKFDTGEVMWKERGLGCGSLMIADGKLLILSEQGTLVVADADPQKYTELGRSSFLTGRCWTVPVLANGKVYGRNAAGHLVCVQLPVQ